MADIFIGIDPGANGGIAIIDIKEGTYSCEVYSDEALIAICKTIDPKKTMCCLERVHSMPSQGVKSMFTFGREYGCTQGILKAFNVPYQEIAPQRWKKEFGLGSNKDKAVDVCKKLFPFADLMATPRSKKPHDGMAEAMLMAEYAKRKL